MAGRTLDLSRLRAKLESLNEPTRDWTEEELVMHMRDWRRLGPRTIAQRLRDLRRLGAHPLMPVKLHGSRYELVDSFYNHMRYRETVEKKAPTAVRNDFKAVIVLGDYLGVPREVWPRAPAVPCKAKKVLRSPEDIHALLHADYVEKSPERSYENHLVKYLLAFDFGFGLRFPSEAHALRIQDFDPKNHTLIVTEPKKGNPTRRLLIEPTWLCCGKTRASLAQYLKWRAKVDVGGTDAFFLKPNGEPFPSKEALKAWLDGRVKPKFPWFHDYMGRTWCANARLIEWNYDYARVADWLGHDSVDMTRENYEAEARLHVKRFGTGWIERAFKGPKKSKHPSSDDGATPSVTKDAPGDEGGAGNPLAPKQSPSGGVSVQSSPYGESAPGGIHAAAENWFAPKEGPVRGVSEQFSPVGEYAPAGI